MKIIEYKKLGKPIDVLKLTTVPHQVLKAGEIRVKVLATPIHPSNLLQISGNYGTTPDLPSIGGSEGIGEVIEVSTEITHLSVGQHVLLASGGTWCDEMVGPAQNFIPVPMGGDIEQMSMLAISPLTAHLILSSFVDLKEGDWIVQSAANSAVGELIIQLAAQQGIKTVNVVRRESLIPELKALGADAVLIDGPDLSEKIAAATDNAAISFAIDCVGGETFSRLLACLAHGGTLTSYGSLSMQPSSLTASSLIFNDVRLRGFWLSKWYEVASPEDKQAAFGQIIPLVMSGALKVKIDSRFSLEEIKKAVTRAAESGRSGKVLICPN